MDIYQLANKAKLPSFLQLGTSDIPNAGLGIFAKHRIKPGVFLGVYEGEYSTKELYPHSKYRWGLCSTDKAGRKRGDKSIAYIDAYDINKSNWCRYVNGSRTEKTANVDSRQYYDTIEYWSIRAIRPDEELLVYYGPGYNKTFKIK